MVNSQDKYGIDSQKLIYHIPELSRWINGEIVYPIYIDLGLTSRCNHRCIFCAFDFLGYEPIDLDINCLKNFIQEAARKGVKSIMFAGEGEPLLHNYIIEAVNFTKASGIDVAITTNGVLLDKFDLEKLLQPLTWLRISLDASTPETYAYLHNTAPEEFTKVVENIRSVVHVKNKIGLGVTIGVQFLLLPYNYPEVIDAVNMMKNLEVDYFVVKPYSQHPSSVNKIRCNFDKEIPDLEIELSKYSNEKFEVILRKSAVESLKTDKPYDECLGLDFITRITANGDVYPCNNFVGNKEFVFGNICTQSFSEIWEGKRRKEVVQKINQGGYVSKCRKGCRLENINRFLTALKNPPPHVNFI